MKKISILLITTVMASSMLIGCGSKQNNNVASDSQPTENAQTNPPSSTKKPSKLEVDKSGVPVVFNGKPISVDAFDGNVSFEFPENLYNTLAFNTVPSEEGDNQTTYYQYIDEQIVLDNFIMSITDTSGYDEKEVKTIHKMESENEFLDIISIGDNETYRLVEGSYFKGVTSNGNTVHSMDCFYFDKNDASGRPTHAGIVAFVVSDNNAYFFNGRIGMYIADVLPKHILDNILNSMSVK